MRLVVVLSALVLGQANEGAPASDRPWWARSLPEAADAGTPKERTATVPAVDAGVGVGVGADGGADAGLDAGVDAGPAPERWEIADGGFFDDAGVTDRLFLRVGTSVRLQFPRVILMHHCDAPLLRFDALAEAIDAVGVDAGRTQCGIWYLTPWSTPGAQPFPDRLFDVHVAPAR